MPESGCEMRFDETGIEGVVVVEINPIEDERGFFARSWCAREFREHGLSDTFVQENVGFNIRRGTMRGFHYQDDPHAEDKLVRCVRGLVWDVALDLRVGSTTFGQWFGTELSDENRAMLHVPKGCAHGYLTLVDGTEIRYLTSAFYEPSAARGIRYDDPEFALEWPSDISVVSHADRGWPLWTDPERTGEISA
jgi:dTDP-4-dehydrorhamnose 3,5-epimerase